MVEYKEKMNIGRENIPGQTNYMYKIYGQLMKRSSM